MAIKARLSQKDDRKIICRHCRAEIARVVDWPIFDKHDPHYPRIVSFSPGWEVDEKGIWFLPPRQMKRISQGRAPRSRRDPLRFDHRDEIDNLVGRSPFNLPVQARCRCGWLNEINPNVLRVCRREVDLPDRMASAGPNGSIIYERPEPWDVCPYE